MSKTATISPDPLTPPPSLHERVEEVLNLIRPAVQSDGQPAATTVDVAATTTAPPPAEPIVEPETHVVAEPAPERAPAPPHSDAAAAAE